MTHDDSNSPAIAGPSETHPLRRALLRAALGLSTSLPMIGCAGEDAWGDTERGETSNDTFVDDDFPIGRSLGSMSNDDVYFEDEDIEENDDLDDLDDLDEDDDCDDTACGEWSA